ncbi:cilia- and flagella-associated protein 206-like [Neocloeon triangulifer]|uniref:cilia- and flagella-associated protein 206-like n=1 Tax=Neocloeon triangulifer TaxID=2078957 RepID=UPI00286EC62F|nr:cilia- and flagella-associated protein 206-like [Neocloeon triangulifer]
MSSSPEEKIQEVINYVIMKEPKLSPNEVEFLVRLDMQYSGLNPLSTLLSDEDLAHTVHLDVISSKKINMLAMKTQAEYQMHVLKSQKEITGWLNGELERMLRNLLEQLAEDKDRHENKAFYCTLADIFLHTFTLKNYVFDEVRTSLETLMPRTDLKKFFRLEIEEQLDTVKALFKRALGSILLFNPEGRVAAELTGMYLALYDLQVLLTAELESDLDDSGIYIKLIQALLDGHQLSGAFDSVFAQSHALLTYHLQMEIILGQMLRKILCSKARLEILEFRVDTVRSELVLDQSHHATGDAPDSMLVNLHELGQAFTDIYCEYLALSNINCVYERLKKIGEQIFNSLHEETFSQIFEKYPETPLTDECQSCIASPKTCQSPLIAAIYDAEWVPVNPELPLALNGICVVSVLDKHSYIKKGDLSLGLCKWRDQFYTLSSPEAMDEFGKNPRKYADVVHRAGHKRPELILLLDMQDQFPALERLKTLRRPIHMMTSEKASRARAERLPMKEEWNDAWSEWDKPHVLDTQYETKNIGAHPSNIQRDRETQCAPRVDSEAQTMSDVCVNTDRPAVPLPRLVSHVAKSSKEEASFEDLKEEVEEEFGIKRHFEE